MPKLPKGIAHKIKVIDESDLTTSVVEADVDAEYSHHPIGSVVIVEPDIMRLARRQKSERLRHLPGSEPDTDSSSL